VRRYVEETVRQAEEQGFVTTLLGRRRYLPELKSDQGSVVAFGRRTAINTPIQGTAADLIKVAMIGIHGELARRNLRSRMIIQIHDELVFEVLRAEQDEVVAMVRSQMESALALSVPIKVDVGLGDNWYEAH
jgi:DNA polymerase-1